MSNLRSARMRIIGPALRRYREAAGYDLHDAAGVLGCHQSKISRIETGDRGIRAGELGKLLAEYRADPDGRAALEALACAPGNGWWDDYRDLLTIAHADFAATEAAAARIEAYAPLQVPELLQTKDYAQAVTAADPWLPARLQPFAVDAAIARQHAIVRDGHAEITVILGEAALRQPAGSPAMLRAQLRYLAGLAENPPATDHPRPPVQRRAESRRRHRGLLHPALQPRTGTWPRPRRRARRGHLPRKHQVRRRLRPRVHRPARAGTGAQMSQFACCIRWPALAKEAGTPQPGQSAASRSRSRPAARSSIRGDGSIWGLGGCRIASLASPVHAGNAVPRSVWSGLRWEAAGRFVRRIGGRTPDAGRRSP